MGAREDGDTEWRSASLGWFDGRRPVGAGLVPHRPVPRLDRFTPAYLPEGPVVDWTGGIDAWLDPLAARLRARGTFAIRLVLPVHTHTWSAAQVKAAGWLPQSPEDGFGVGHPRFRYELPLTDRSEDDLLGAVNQLWRRAIKKAAKAGGETMFAALNPENPDRIRLYLARHPDDLVAATVLVRVGAHACYSYGASSTEKRQVRGSNACQRATIRDSLAAGCDVYDLRGITPTLDTADPHAELIQFKVGTGGRAVCHVGA